MNSYKFADLSVGMSEEFTVTITEEMMDKFIDITGDVSPIHVNADYAKEHGFKTRVCHGMLFGSMFSTLARGLSARGTLPFAQCGNKVFKPRVSGRHIKSKR